MKSGAGRPRAGTNLISARDKLHQIPEILWEEIKATVQALCGPRGSLNQSARPSASPSTVTREREETHARALDLLRELSVYRKS